MKKKSQPKGAPETIKIDDIKESFKKMERKNKPLTNQQAPWIL